MHKQPSQSTLITIIVIPIGLGPTQTYSHFSSLKSSCRFSLHHSSFQLYPKYSFFIIHHFSCILHVANVNLGCPAAYLSVNVGVHKDGSDRLKGKIINQILFMVFLFFQPELGYDLFIFIIFFNKKMTIPLIKDVELLVIE